MCLLVFTATLIAYIPVFNAGFIWDDSGHVTRSDLLSPGGLARIWFEPGATQQYYPLLHSAFWVEHHLWGANPLGYHLLNVLLHATSACLLAVILRRLSIPGAPFAALLFALHPVAVESVAWVSEQKNTLSTALYLCAVLAYLRYDENRNPRQYALALLLFAGALLSKTVTATLPGGLLVILWWKNGRLAWRRDVVPLLPWFGVGISAGLFTAHFETTQIGATGDDFALSFLQRGLLAGRIIWFYLGKLVWPHELLFIYPRWHVDASATGQFMYPCAVIFALAGLAWWARCQRGPLAAFLFFGGSLFPALGFFNVYPFIFSFVADHFQYLASLGIFTLAGAGAAFIANRLPRSGTIVGGTVVLTVLGFLTWNQSAMYRNSASLYEATLARNPQCWMAHNNLAILLAGAGKLDEAVSHLHRALDLRPDFAAAENNLGDDLIRLGKPLEAVPHLEHALRLQPDYAEAHYNLAVALMALDRTREGIAQFEAALAAQPDYVVAHRGLGRALATTGQLAQGLPHLEKAVALDPGEAEAHIDLGFALTLAGRPAAALPQFRDAVRLRPDFAEAHNLYGRCLVANGDPAEAIVQFREALRLKPDLADARYNLANTLRQSPGTP